MDVEKEKATIEKIKHSLTEVYTHDYLITRDDATKLGIRVDSPDKDLDELIMKLYQEYEDALLLQDPFDADTTLGTQSSVTQNLSFGFIESLTKSFSYNSEITLTRSQPQQPQILMGPGQPQPTIIPGSVPGPSSVTVKIKQGKWQSML